MQHHPSLRRTAVLLWVLSLLGIFAGCSHPPNAFTGKWISPGRVQATVTIDDREVEILDQNGVPVATLPYRLERSDLLIGMSPSTNQPAMSIQLLADGNSARVSTINAGLFSQASTIYRAK